MEFKELKGNRPIFNIDPEEVFRAQLGFETVGAADLSEQVASLWRRAPLDRARLVVSGNLALANSLEDMSEGRVFKEELVQAKTTAATGLVALTKATAAMSFTRS